MFKGKKRRREEEENAAPPTTTATNDLPQQPVMAATSMEELAGLKKRMTEMEREIARLVKVNSEMFQFTANLVLDEEGG